MGVKQLRGYQIETIDNITESIKHGNHSIIVQQPPRTGKTVIMAEIARRATQKGSRILFVVHRKEIVDQVKRSFAEQNVNMDLATIGMVQTITRRVAKMSEPQIIFVDEAHHSLAKSYIRILEQFPNALKLLFTATPIRLNGKGFEDVATDLIQGKPIPELIDKGFLAPVDYYAPADFDATHIKVNRTGEFDDKSIQAAFKPKIYGNAVKTYQKLATGKQAIAYTYNVASAERLAKEFNSHGIVAKAVSGKTPKAERNQIIKDYREGVVQIVTNAELFTEGLDLPNVDCVIMLRPTQSLSLFLQFAMRSMNPREGKRAVIIDHVGNVQRFGLPTIDRQWSLKGTGGKTSNDNNGTIKSTTTCEFCFGTFYKTGDKCPYCGHEIAINVQEIEVVEDAELKKVATTRAERAKEIMLDSVTDNIAGKRPADLQNMAEVKAYQKFMNYKPGWVFFYGKKRGFIK
ncbi:DEAD/DEAH box helicase family protein [Latilactobacillus curvatus]|uniref:DEAD/DEAH box helicase family protein n=1 Tax=Latilactobacillus curvatus TaxID=28038 RepID=A0AAJ5URG0_LATCU|nr:DEAD/DEAH box helicase family protein [Latilactobacillus curvatus]WDC91662.1 DEAD/DEAH box helicase family protein [Latilactobacillus curvatus]